MLNKKHNPLLALFLIVVAVFIAFNAELPRYKPDIQKSLDSFSVDRALIHLKKISEKPHFIGTKAHSEVREYLVSELKKMGLEVEIQEQEIYNPKWQVGAKTYNIISKIKGSDSQSKALLLLSHYDAAPHSKSYGASDDGNGIVVILESIRAFLHTNKSFKNDIIVLFSDAEEIGLLGAKSFVEYHPWAKNVGLVLNFEARGSGGPGYMLLETNGGNKEFIRLFAEAKLPHPVANSLMYSIYKMLPNDTDLTVFRENGNIDGFNFAFIDDHFDYHTEQDNYERIDRNTLAHQGEYAFYLLNYFADRDLKNLRSNKDNVFFNFPYIGLVHFPFDWLLPIFLISALSFIVILIIGLQVKRINFINSLKSFIPLSLSLLTALVVGYFGWKLLLWMSPGNKEILHGFPYMGKMLIVGYIAIVIALFLKIYKPYLKQNTIPDLLFAPILFWLIVNLFIVFYLKGAGFLLMPLLILLVVYGFAVFNKDTLVVGTILVLPIVVIFSPLLTMLPVGLGLKMLFVSGILLVLILAVLLYLFNSFEKRNSLILLFSVIGVLSISSAFFQVEFTKNRKKPNSIVYYQETDSERAYWMSYDLKPDGFTTPFLTKEPEKENSPLLLNSKYETPFTLFKQTDSRKIEAPQLSIRVEEDSINNKKILIYTIKPKRNSNLLYLFSKNALMFYELKINGELYDLKENKEKDYFTFSENNSKILTYYFADGVDSLQLHMKLDKNQNPKFVLYDISLDLLENKNFSIEPREENTMPKPFVVNDAIIIRSEF